MNQMQQRNHYLTTLCIQIPHQKMEVHFVRNRTLTLIEREDDTRSWDNFLFYFSHNTMPT
jgi:hypothetical protein